MWQMMHRWLGNEWRCYLASLLQKRVVGWTKVRPALVVEPLEERCVPVVGAFATPASIAPGTLFTGVVRLDVSGGSYGSGALLDTGRHILTAAHVAMGSADIEVLFELARDGSPVLIPIHVPPNQNWELYSSVHPSFDDVLITFGNDVSVLVLPDQESSHVSPNRHLIAPYGASQYQLYTENDEVGQEFLFVGYGATGTGSVGELAGTGGVKRAGHNRWDAETSLMRNELQVVAIDGDADVVSFTLTYQGDTTADLSSLATGQDVYNALVQAIPDLAGNIRVFSDTGLHATWFVEFTNQLAGTDVGLISGHVTGYLPADLLPEPQIGSVQVVQGGYVSAGTNALVADFDSGLALNDAIGMLYARPNPGLEAHESAMAHGDSGGPAFLNGKIAGISSFMLSPGVSPPDSDHSFNQSFGEFWWGTRVSTFVPWIESLPTISGAFDLVLDMNQQVFGRDGLIEDLTITARRSGADLELWVDNPAYPAYSGRYYKGSADRITSLTIRGSDDNETIRLEGPLHLGPGAAGAITVWGRHGNDTVIVGDPAGGNLADLGGPLEVVGGDGEYDELILNDVANQEATTYIVDTTTLTRRFLPPITYRYFSKLTLNSGSGPMRSSCGPAWPVEGGRPHGLPDAGKQRSGVAVEVEGVHESDHPWASLFYRPGRCAGRGGEQAVVGLKYGSGYQEASCSPGGCYGWAKVG